LWISPAAAYTQIVNEALNGNREGRILTIVFGVIPISLVLIEDMIRTQSSHAGTAIAIIPPILCGAAAWQGAQRTGHTTRRAWWWATVAVFAYYAWWIVIAGLFVWLVLE
jgi:hypothetical protein